MEKATIEREVIAYIESRGGIIPGDKLACAYLDAGLVDSMGIIEMISEFESKYDIRFSAEDLQSQEFQTIGGLVATIARLAHGVG